ncbi:MAG: purine-binding chemotaxis protein CheW [Planctomycetes bacterium]|nr:purine-binding chemotaxis protein CheW [Planctomycetota bacterium]
MTATASPPISAAPDVETTAAPSAKAPVVPASARLPGGLLPNKDGKTFQVVSFRIGDEEYGVDIMAVQEIILVGVITQVPEVPEHVLGVINLRGNVIPIMNLRRRFGMPDQPVGETTRIVVMNLGGRTVGAVVDGVDEVLRLSTEEISATPASLGGAGKDYVLGLARRKERLLILLDMARLLGGSDAGITTNHTGTEG